MLCLVILTRGVMLQQKEVGRLIIPVSMKEAIKEFSGWRSLKVKACTVKGYDRELKNFCLFLRNPAVAAITFNDIMDYLNGIIELGWDPNSLIMRSMALRKFFEFMRLRGFTSLNEELIPIPRRQYKLPNVATEESYQQLIESIPVESNDPRHIRNLAFANMLWDTGARNGELLSINVSDIDLDNRKSIIRTEKNRGSRPFREVFWTDSTNSTLKRWIKKRDYLRTRFDFDEDDALFISVCSQKAGQRLTVKGTGEMLRRYCRRAGMPYLNAHAFRHHMGHDIINQGGSTADVMNILGHATVASSSIYMMMANAELENRYRIFKGE